MSTAYFNIGSNKGDRRSFIERAVALIELQWGHTAALSRYFESDPWGYDSNNIFVNLGVSIDVGDDTPLQVLDKIMAIQHLICGEPHRDAAGRYIDRFIDIDIIAIDQLEVNTPELTLPHPRMHLRPFVLQPMAELAPNWVHPLLHQTPSQLLTDLLSTHT
jgi:2-amino-4-hydroxy-6-hydroxymethyldihydropteridine diphosphokinase